MSVLITMFGSLNNSENAFKLQCKILNYSNEMRSKHSIIQDSIENNWLISEKREMFESWNSVKIITQPQPGPATVCKWFLFLWFCEENTILSLSPWQLHLSTWWIYSIYKDHNERRKRRKRNTKIVLCIINWAN